MDSVSLNQIGYKSYRPDLASILWHEEERVIHKDYRLSIAGHRHRVVRSQVRAGVRRLRVGQELRLDGELKARHVDRYIEIGECGVRPIAMAPKHPGAAVRKYHRGQHQLLNPGTFYMARNGNFPFGSGTANGMEPAGSPSSAPDPDASAR